MILCLHGALNIFFMATLSDCSLYLHRRLLYLTTLSENLLEPGSVNANDDTSSDDLESHSDSEADVVERQPKENSVRAVKNVRQPGQKRKIYPPGPFCSMQFLEEIAKGEFDESYWRRMKRSRTVDCE